MNVQLVVMASLLVKHFVADFPLQTTEMAMGKGKDDGWIVPLSRHVAVHAILTCGVLLPVFGLKAFAVAAIEALAHFCIDRVKAKKSLGGRFAFPTPHFWWALGADQLAHGMCYVAIASLS